jgi:hypothetical protein
MHLPARIPDSLAHLDVDVITSALISAHANVRNAARALGVPSGDLRKLVLVDERLSAAALEAIELKLDVAESNLCEALRSEDPRRRDAVSMFMLRNVGRAAKRGYAVAASGLEASASVAEPKASLFRCNPKMTTRTRMIGRSCDSEVKDHCRLPRGRGLLPSALQRRRRRTQ